MTGTRQGWALIGDHGAVLIVDAANVVGSRPDGWWRDRPKAAAKLCDRVGGAIDGGRLAAPVVVVLEGAARAGALESDGGGMRVVHAPASGDDEIARIAADATAAGLAVIVVTADRELHTRVQRVGCEVVGPRWLLERVQTD